MTEFQFSNNSNSALSSATWLFDTIPASRPRCVSLLPFWWRYLSMENAAHTFCNLKKNLETSVIIFWIEENGRIFDRRPWRWRKRCRFLYTWIFDQLIAQIKSKIRIEALQLYCNPDLLADKWLTRLHRTVFYQMSQVLFEYPVEKMAIPFKLSQFMRKRSEKWFGQSEWKCIDIVGLDFHSSPRARWIIFRKIDAFE